ncbi:MAG: glycoside hydrolase family 2 protein [Alphaproteobacteria bacterium]|nr:glycoside hydrolase family 2 protein [Alphaproteobacteria bacterium]
MGLIPAAAQAKAVRPKRQAEPLEHELTGPWQFRQSGTGDWLAATVPGTVHTDLLAAGKIPDPFYRTNELDLQWIDKKDWEYRTTLDLDAATLAHDHLELCFAGLDTYADVYLNDVLVLHADNMFRRWTTDIKAHAKPGANVLRVLLRSPVQEGLKLLAAYGFDPPAVVEWSEIGGLGDKKISMFTRKAPYHYGWDWGPRFVTSGIWRKVTLRAWNTARISDLHIVQDSLTPDEAHLTAVFEIVSDIAGPAVVDVQCPDHPAVKGHTRIRLQPGLNTAEVKFVISKPRLWWSNGLGEAFLYNIVGQLVAARASDRREARTGLRTLKVVQKPDANGTSFSVELNGVPVFMKGANHIPNDSFLPRVTPARYEHEVRSAVDTHMNILRVWGGGIYEDDYFYDLCDENGILIWQEFIFACVMYPGTQDFLDNVRAEAVDNVRRLRNHPCIALWCGNNEIDTAWQNDVPNGGWGWKQKYTPPQRDELWTAYKAIFYGILAETVAQHDPQRFYWPSSPLAFWDGHDTVRHADLNTKQQSGDIHYWGVWWGELPFSSYRTYIGRFMTEYGFQSFPEFKTIEAFAAPGDYDIFSEVLKSHQRSSIGNGTIQKYMARDYKVPKDFRQFLYVGQVLQAEGIKTAMEAHRAHMPYCMGSLFWQINDCWPVASWSSIDYYGRWKAQQYFARKSFAPELVTSWIDGDTVKVCVVSDRLTDVPVTLTLEVLDFNGTVHKTVTQPFLLAKNSSAMAFTGPAADLLAGASPESVLLLSTLADGSDVLAEDRLYFRSVKDLALPQASVDVNVKDLGGEFAIGLSSPVLVKNLYLSLDDVDGFFSDNYFDLLPHRPKVVRFKPAGSVSAKALKNDLKLMHMAQAV